MDVASTIPFDAIGYLVTGTGKLNLTCNILGLLRFWRLRRVKHLFTRYTWLLVMSIVKPFYEKLTKTSHVSRVVSD